MTPRRRTLSADEVIRILGLTRHQEGGLFAETYRSPIVIPEHNMPAGYDGERSAATAIFYLLKPDAFSALHRVRGDEMFHFYLGDPVEMLHISADGSERCLVMGPDLALNMQVQVTVPGGTWQGARLRTGGRFALLGTTMSPGFDYRDFEMGSRDSLIASFPALADHIRAFTR